MHRHSHGETAADQHGGISRADQEVGLVAGGSECRRISLAVDKIGQKQAAEKHDFGEQKHPHADSRSVFLLLGVFEMMLEPVGVGGMTSQLCTTSCMVE